jgi:hypothetical protein
MLLVAGRDRGQAFAALVGGVGLLMVGLLVVIVFGALLWGLFGNWGLAAVAALLFLLWRASGRRSG